MRNLKWYMYLSFVATAIVMGPVAFSQDLDVFWKDGLHFQTADKEFRMKIGGRIQNDWGFFLDDAFGEDGVEFRRARLYVSGLIYDYIEFKTQYDFAGSNPDFKDVYIGLTGLDSIGGIRVGHFKEPFSLEALTSSKYLTFMERSLPVGVFAPSRNVGILWHNAFWEDRMTTAVGVFKESDNSSALDIGEDSWNVTGRMTGLPWYENEGEQLIHLGAAVTYKTLDEQAARFRLRTRPEAHLADRIVNAEFAPGEPERMISAGAEAALVYSSFSMQGEYIFSTVEQKTSSDVDLSGFYVQSSYFLTGEHRRYKTSSATFDRIKPNRNFLSDEGGWGAWELALRYSWLDLQDNQIPVNSGDKVWGLTGAVNWYLNPNTRVMFNWVHTELDDTIIHGKDLDNAVQMRFQVDF